MNKRPRPVLRTDRTRAATRPPRATRRAMPAVLITLSFVLTLLLPPPGHARIVFDPNDPAFREATPETFDPNPAPGQTTFAITRNGVAITFSTSGTRPLVNCHANGCRIEFGGNPVNITFDPPVAAAGLTFMGDECRRSRITFTGSAGTETFQPQFPNTFVGAADIGDISAVRLEEPCLAYWDNLRFVPSAITPPPTLRSNLTAAKSGPALVRDGQRASYEVTVGNLGPDAATGVQVIDFLPGGGGTLASTTPAANVSADGRVATINLADIPPNFGSRVARLDFDLPSFQPALCNESFLNVAWATSFSLEGDPTDNLAWFVSRFDTSTRPATGENCANGRDDDCDGRADCADSECSCFQPTHLTVGGPLRCTNGQQPTVITSPIPGSAPVLLGCGPQHNPARQQRCAVEMPAHSGQFVPVPAFCCEQPRPGDPEDRVRRRINCPNPHDPNYKESEPATNTLGFGYTEAGRLMTYTIHYENTGTGDAHDVSILDPLDPDLDDSTLVISAGGSYDAATRTVVWRDPLVPPHTPRSVSFSVAVRADAPPDTIIRNVGTIIFPDADPPERTDTNALEHIIPDRPVAADLGVLQCTRAAPGSDEWRVDLVNAGFGWAYNVTAEIINPPPSVNVISPSASFSHPDDPAGFRTTVARSVTTSDDAVRFTTQTPSDPCGALTWRIRWETFGGVASTRDVQAHPDRDRDAVADAADNCPDAYNPAQADADGDGRGDVCDNLAPDCGGAYPSVRDASTPTFRKLAVTILGVTDADGDPVTVTIDRVMQDEPTDGGGAGDPCPDAYIPPNSSTAYVRDERSAAGNGRVYTVYFTATDGRGASCQGSVKVSVPHEQGGGAVDDGPAYDSTVCTSKANR